MNSQPMPPVFTSKKKILVLVMLVVVICVLFSVLYIQHMKSQMTAHIELKIAEQKTILSSLALVTANDGADSVVEKVIIDCSSDNRARFDQQLGQLQQLSGLELVEVEQLFNACGVSNRVEYS